MHEIHDNSTIRISKTPNEDIKFGENEFQTFNNSENISMKPTRVNTSPKHEQIINQIQNKVISNNN